MQNTIEVTVGQRRFHVQVTGAGQHILLLHGYPLDHRMWDRCISLLQDQYLCIAPDLRGFGGNSEERFGFSIADLAADCSQILNALQVREPVVVCGLSMGGYVAMEFVERYREQVAGAILTNTRCNADDAKGVATRLETASKALRDGAVAATSPMMEKLFASDSHSEQNAARSLVEPMMASTHPSTLAWSQMAMALRRSFCERMSQWQLPVACVGGEHDTICPPQVIENMHRAIPNSRLHIISRSAHLSPLEQPKAFAEIVRSL
jgi:pimeloyl-ACP methyl ester carboxylesterase